MQGWTPVLTSDAANADTVGYVKGNQFAECKALLRKQQQESDAWAADYQARMKDERDRMTPAQRKALDSANQEAIDVMVRSKTQSRQ
jgi:hypothetical protein